MRGVLLAWLTEIGVSLINNCLETPWRKEHRFWLAASKRKYHLPLNDEIIESHELNIKKLKSGPLGGDQQLGALIADGKIDILIFFWDPMSSQPHDVDVKALLRICVLYNVPTAMNRSTADFLISSRLFKEDYQPTLKDYQEYINRSVK